MEADTTWTPSSRCCWSCSSPSPPGQSIQHPHHCIRHSRTSRADLEIRPRLDSLVCSLRQAAAASLRPDPAELHPAPAGPCRPAGQSGCTSRPSLTAVYRPGCWPPCLPSTVSTPSTCGSSPGTPWSSGQTSSCSRLYSCTVMCSAHCRLGRAQDLRLVAAQVKQFLERSGVHSSTGTQSCITG